MSWLVGAAGCTGVGDRTGDDTDAEQSARNREARQAPRPIPAGDSLWIDELTWMEVRDRIAEGYTTAIIATGGIEENGPYLATGKHNLILQATCPAIARRLGRTMCAPVVAFVPQGDIEPPSGLMQFPGTLSVRDTTYRALLLDLASSLKQHGFTDIVFIGDSGGNQEGMELVADELNSIWGGAGARAHFVREFYDPGWELTERFTADALGVTETADDGYHDDIWVTAMMMVTDPDSVRHSQRVEAGLASINGVSIADLEKTVALGRAMIEFRAQYTADVIRQRLEN